MLIIEINSTVNQYFKNFDKHFSTMYDKVLKTCCMFASPNSTQIK